MWIVENAQTLKKVATKIASFIKVIRKERTMNRDKQTEIQQFVIDLQNASQKASKIITDETANYVKQNHKYNNLVDYAKAHIKSRFEYEAEFLVEIGYAKASDVAREIFEEMIQLLSMRMGIKEVLAELKKKYTETEKENEKV